MSVVLADTEHKQRLQLYAEILSPDWTDSLFTFDQSFSSNSALTVVNARIANSIDSYGGFDLLVRDDQRIIKDGQIGYNYIINFKGKRPFQSTQNNILSGMIKKITRVYNPASNERLYKINGVGVGYILTHTIINYILQSGYKNVITNTSNVEKYDPEMLVGKHIERVFLDKKVLPAIDQGLILKERGNFNLDKINYDIKNYINSIDVHGIYAGNFCTDIANACGCLFLIDEDNSVFFDRPMNNTLGHYITNTSDDMQLSANTTMMTEATIEDIGSTYAEDGYFDKMYTYSQQSRVSQSNTEMGSYTPLYRNDVAYRIPRAGATQFYDLSFMLQKFGIGTNSDDPNITFLHGLIVNDNNWQVGTEIIGHFAIPIQYIKDTPSWVNRFNIRFRKPVEVGSPYWIVLKKIGDDPNNTVGWWHDGVHTYSAIGSAWRFSKGRSDTQENITEGWNYSYTGPKYTYAFAQRTPTLQTSFSVNSGSKYNRIAPVEKIETVDWIKDQSTSFQYMAYITQHASRVRRNIPLGRCSIPLILPRIGYAAVLNLKQKISDTETDNVEYLYNINGTTYDFDQIGARWVEIQGDTYDLNVENVIQEDEDELVYVCP